MNKDDLVGDEVFTCPNCGRIHSYLNSLNYCKKCWEGKLGIISTPKEKD